METEEINPENTGCAGRKKTNTEINMKRRQVWATGSGRAREREAVALK